MQQFNVQQSNMQQSMTAKQEWIQHIRKILATDSPFCYRGITENKIFILFAADTFRRRGHEVTIDIVPTQFSISCLIITILPKKTFIEFTLRRKDEPQEIIRQIIKSKCTKVSLRGCGTAIQALFEIMNWALHNGWYTDNTIISTLTHQSESSKQRNTTLNIVIRKG